MRTIRFTPIIMVLMLITSCQNDGEINNAETAISEDTAFTAPDLSMPSTPAPAATVTPPTPEPVSSPANQLVPVQANQKNTSAQKGINPPHGQPGHRCDIPVGAPLSSAPKTPPSAPVNTVPPANTGSQIQTAPINNPGTNVPAPASTATEPGMNPPHGQPGHRCEIPVGAPLPTE